MPNKPAIRTLDPKPETVHIVDRGPVLEGEPEVRIYIQRELSLRQTGLLLELLTSIILDPASGVDLEEVMNLDLNTANGLSMLVGKVIGLGPAVVSRLLAILLNAPDDAEWLLDNLTPAEAMAIIRRGMVQNDLPGLLADFFALQGEITAAVSQARTGKA